MRALRGCLLGIAIFQGLSAWVGMVELLLVPQWFAPMLQGTPFASKRDWRRCCSGLSVWCSGWL